MGVLGGVLGDVPFAWVQVLVDAPMDAVGGTLVVFQVRRWVLGASMGGGVLVGVFWRVPPWSVCQRVCGWTRWWRVCWRVVGVQVQVERVCWWVR